MNIDLPAPVAIYFAAQNRHDIGAMLSAFAASAAVLDEKVEHAGSAAIQAWLETTSRRYRVEVTPLRVEDHTGVTVVTGLVSGDFPGSPIHLRYSFTMSDAGIERLSIA